MPGVEVEVKCKPDFRDGRGDMSGLPTHSHLLLHSVLLHWFNGCSGTWEEIPLGLKGDSARKQEVPVRPPQFSHVVLPGEGVDGRLRGGEKEGGRMVERVGDGGGVHENVCKGILYLSGNLEKT